MVVLEVLLLLLLLALLVELLLLSDEVLPSGAAGKSAAARPRPRAGGAAAARPRPRRPLPRGGDAAASASSSAQRVQDAGGNKWSSTPAASKARSLRTSAGLGPSSCRRAKRKSLGGGRSGPS